MKSRFALILFFILFSVAVSLMTRVVIGCYFFESFDFNFLEVIKVFLTALVYDVATMCYIVIPFVLYAMFIPQKIFATIGNKLLILIVSFLSLGGIIFNAFSEFLFWEEFAVKYNFIAVDYLVYTNEVVGNIKESYPLTLLLSIIFILTSIVFFFLFKYKVFQRTFLPIEYNRSLKIGFAFLCLPLFFYAFLPQKIDVFSNQYTSELSKNGLNSFVMAFKNNKLSYEKFYITLPQDEVQNYLKHLQNIQNVSAGEHKQEIRPNVVLIMVESLSAKFLGTFGNEKNITANLDSLAQNGLFFENIYATGTRTVRGMEAVTLSTPPAPGRSIVKREDNADLFSVATVFKNHGYQNRFIYGGYGYFDNMNTFFGGNNFAVIDRADFTENEKTFGNIWGLCDEDLYSKALKEADADFMRNTPFFYYLMTTSNHRPYTYPDNKIDIPSKTGRDGAVKYADFAIGDFIKRASQKPWFSNTIFVIIADHCASSAGKTSLALEKYKIPLIVYAPSLIVPQKISKVASQIDTFPTLFGLMGWKDEPKLYGRNILEESFVPRAFVGNYQKLGYFKDGLLGILEPQKKYKEYKVMQNDIFDYDYVAKDNTLLKETVTYYQSSSFIIEQRLNQN